MRGPLRRDMRDDVRIGLHAFRCAAYDVEAAMGVDAANQRMQVGVVIVFIDPHAALGRLEFKTGQYTEQQGWIFGPNATDRIREQMHLEIGRFPAHVGRLIGTEACLIAGKRSKIFGRIDTLEIGGRRDVSLREVVAHDRDFSFASHVTGNRHAVRVKTDVRKRTIQMWDAFADDGRENEVRRALLDTIRDIQITLSRRIEREVSLIHLLPTALQDQIAHYPV